MSVKIEYETYKEVSEDLLSPIIADGLDIDTLKRLYISKLVYLHNLRKRCFKDVNRATAVFDSEDLKHITEAIQYTNGHIRDLILAHLNMTLDNYQAQPSGSPELPPAAS